MPDKPTYEELEQALEKSNMELRNFQCSVNEVQELAKIGNWEWDLEMQDLKWSDEVYCIFGLDPGSFKPSAEVFEAIIHPDDLDSFLKQREEMLNEKKEACIDHRIVLPDGSIRHVLERTKLIVNSQKTVCRVIGTVQDITERKHMEESLNLFKSIVEYSKEAVAISGPKGQLIYINPAHEKLFGRSLEEARLLNYRDYYPPESIEVLNKEVDPALSSGGSWEGILDAFDAKGRRFPLWECAGTILDKTGTMLYGFGFMHDDSKRKKAEVALQESEKKYRSVFAAESDAIFLIDKETGAILETNNAASELYGYTQEELIQLKNSDVSAEPEKTRQATAEIKKSIPLRNHKKKDGTIFPVDISASSFVFNGRDVILAAIRDITERREAEKSLQHSEERLRLSLAGADLGMWDWNIIDGSVTFNERWAAMLGYRLDEIEPNVRAWEALVHPDDMPNVMEALTAHIEGKTESYKTEHRLHHKSGKWVWVMDSGRVIERDYKGKALRTCGTHLDITERKKGDEQREQLISELTSALGQVKRLSGLLPICSYCKQIRDDQGYWNQIESYIRDRSDAEFSHGICPECAKKLYPDMDIYDDNGEVTED
jgi:PAS domain S-box-containing protein